MTKAEKLRIYQSMEEKILQTLDGRTGEQLVSKETDLALGLLANITVAQWRLEGDDPCEEKTTATPDVEPEADKAPVADPAPEPEPEPEPETEPEAEQEDEPSMTKEEVRAKLARLPDQLRVKVAGIMAEMGYGKLSEVPTSRYQELLDKASAVKEA